MARFRRRGEIVEAVRFGAEFNGGRHEYPHAICFCSSAEILNRSPQRRAHIHERPNLRNNDHFTIVQTGDWIVTEMIHGKAFYAAYSNGLFEALFEPMED